MGKHNETKTSAVAVFFLFVSGIAAYTEGVLIDGRFFLYALHKSSSQTSCDPQTRTALSVFEVHASCR